MSAGSSSSKADAARALPGDDARALLWRHGEDAAFSPLVQSVRAVARGPVARAIAADSRAACDWSSERAAVEQALAAASATTSARAHLGRALAAFELAWVDTGAARAMLGAAPGRGESGFPKGLSTGAALISAVDPVLRRHRSLPGATGDEDIRQRLVDIWAAGEATASLAFEFARVQDDLAAVRAAAPAAAASAAGALEYLAERGRPAERRNPARIASLLHEPAVRLGLLEASAAALGPAVDLCAAGAGTSLLREAAVLAGAGSAADSASGFLHRKWLDSGPGALPGAAEPALRRALADAMIDRVFVAQCREWVEDMRQIASARPGTGACTLATAMQMWLWTLQHVQKAGGADAAPWLSVRASLADALAWILAARQQVLDVLHLGWGSAAPAPAGAAWTAALPVLVDLCHVQTARAAGEVGRVCAELVFGFRRHPAWDQDGCSSCYVAGELDALDEIIPGMGATARFYSDVLEIDGSHPAKAGPCAHSEGLEPFLRMRTKMDGCLTGACAARSRAADALARVALPDVPEYPV